MVFPGSADRILAAAAELARNFPDD